MISFKKISIIFGALLVVFVGFYILFINMKSATPKTTTITTPTPVPVPGLEKRPVVQPGGGGESPEFLQAGEDFLKSHPLLQKLPAGSAFFGIEYINEQHLIVHAKTESKERDYEEARKWFAENDIDINPIIIEYW